jgi:hypothetical protein
MTQFKEGDRVRLKRSCSGGIEGEIYTLGYLLGLSSLYALIDSGRREVGTSGKGCLCESNWLLVERGMTNYLATFDGAAGCPLGGWTYTTVPSLTNKTTPKMKLTNLVKKLVDSDTQTLIKAGFINGDLELTSTGKEELFAIIFEGNKAALVTAAQAVLDEQAAK